MELVLQRVSSSISSTDHVKTPSGAAQPSPCFQSDTLPECGGCCNKVD